MNRLFDTNVTNVLYVANGHTDHADAVCVHATIGFLVAVRERHLVLLDDAQRILEEYLRGASLAGQPGLGDAFLRWLWDNQANPILCRQVRITQVALGSDDYEEFPNDSRLFAFDRSDRKFVAVALASKEHPEIANATDRDWWVHREALKDNGVEVRFLCPHLMQP